ncbi:Wall-associated receptor kinase 1 [Zea mays]|uniref:Wall-associated receptor kinase 1 n=1 Tax=Zea mays TaxID=4577 RepID=A0A3L6DQV1_MAIZE|nr:Wall-associated receptor kinase 1 [Zea mays]
MSRRVAAALVVLCAATTTVAVLAGDEDDVTLPGCRSRCGNMSIPYPFGVEAGCYLPGFNVTCRRRNGDGPAAAAAADELLFLGDGTVQVLEISIPNATVLINSSAGYFDGDEYVSLSSPGTWSGALGSGDGDGVYTLAWGRNKLFAMGYNVQVRLEADNETSSVCVSVFFEGYFAATTDDCAGFFCCQSPIWDQRTSYRFKALPLNGSAASLEHDTYAWIMDSELRFQYGAPQKDKALTLPALLDWRINHTTCHANASSPACRSRHSFCHDGSLEVCRRNDSLCHNSTAGFGRAHICRCDEGYRGNPYLPNNGCKVWEMGLAIGGGTGFLLLALGAPIISRKIKLHKAKRKKERFFKQNHGLLLQQLVSQNSDISERMIITIGELEKATNNFHPSHEVGGGGHGVVYKGLLDLQVVAIKKSKIIVKREIDDFINEVAILSQINHRNIVKLLGCCLEAEVPLLVYEFISNGTLSHHLHVEGTISLSWDDRLRIALEISKALAYLHSSATKPILHRDIKSSNILLDDNLTAKVSDFGASKYIPIDRTGVTTDVQGTFGYLDPMYYYTSRLTDKSDVFSFGVLLIELLTRKKPYAYRSDDGDGLVSEFSSLLDQGTLVDIIDPQIMEEDKQVDEVAKLAAKCTKLSGEDRPTMREVEMALQNLRGIEKHVHNNTTSKNKYEKGKTSHCLPFGGLAIETSRQYTMEEEMLLSARYPR